MKFNNFLRKYTSIKKMAIKTVLIDLSGTLHIGNQPTENAIEALKRLRKTGVKVKFVTNTTKDSLDTLYERLIKIGFELNKNEIYTSLTTAVNYVKQNKLNPFYFLTEDARKDFPTTQNNEYDSVVFGLSPKNFNYDKINEAFNILIKDTKIPLIAIHQSKYYKTEEGLAVGPACFVKGLEYCTNRTAITLGKPNPLFFQSAISDDVVPQECIMIGDDGNDDIVGAMNIGMKGILVRTGKWLPNIVTNPPPTITLDNFDKAVSWIEENLEQH